MQKDTIDINEPFKMGLSIKYKIMLNVILVIFIAHSASPHLAVDHE